MLKDAGIPMATVLEMVGHSDAKTSALYTHVGRAALEQAATAFPVYDSVGVAGDTFTRGVGK